MGRAQVVDPDTERPPDVTGLPVLDRVAAVAQQGAPLPELRLPFELRSRSRLRARLDDGREVALVLPRGTVLRGGAIVEGGGLRVRVRAADEDVIEARAADAQALARAAYHLGNRHVPVQVRGDALVFGYDPVLVDMLVRMGVATRRTWAPFEPEAGAYGGHGHAH
jgi:urease accessory protein